VKSEHWERVAALFDEATKLGPAEREDLLSSLADDGLRNELRSLLDAHEGRGAFDELKEYVTGPGAEQLLQLQPGDEVGPYRILREIATGGMATVYLAEDLKHERQVAVKVLGPVLAAVLGAERFAHEIMTTARLQHPHILPLLDSGQAEGLPYYVMPYIEGETLRERLNRETQLGVEDAVRIAVEVADALDYAHRNEVVHRDIKPENILLHDGRPLVADFGIALAVTAAATGRTTEAGLLLGTPHYMSPEQATAQKDLTHRSDIYSLGCVLYEMLAGEPPHTGNSTQEIIRRIVTDEPRPISELRKSAPHNVAAATAKSLEKLPADRFASARGFARALEDPSFTTPVTRVDPRFGSPPARRHRLTAGLAMLAAVAVAAAAWGWLRVSGDAAPRPTVEFHLEPPAPGMYFGSGLALSPDGRRLVTEVLIEDGWALYQRDLDARDWQVVQGTGRATGPFFSPDGAWLAYFSSRERAIKKVPVGGGPSQTIVRAAWMGGASWGPDGTIVFQTKVDPSTASPPGLFRVSADGGELQRVTLADSTIPPIHGSPRWLPGGEVLLFKSGISPPFVWAVVPESGEAARLTAGMSPASDRSDRLTYVTLEGTLMVQSFDPGTLTLEGSPRPIAEGISIGMGGFAPYSVARDGSVAYLAPSERGTRLLLVDRQGASRAVFSPGIGSSIGAPRFSPTGDRIAFARDGDIWIYSLAQDAARRLSFEDGQAGDPAWSSDGRFVAYSVDGAGDESPASVYLRAADGTGEAEVIVTGEADLWEVDFAPGDTQVVVFSVDNIHTASVGGSGSGSGPVPLMETGAFLAHGTLSPDGRWLAYRSNESGVNEVYVRSYPDMGPATVISAGGGNAPAWSGDGSEIFYWSRGRMNVASVRIEGGTIAVVDRAELFHAGPFQQEWNRNFDVHPRGNQFVMVSRPENRIVWRVNALADRP
jgi:serine/threonine-protein kinase